MCECESKIGELEIGLLNYGFLDLLKMLSLLYVWALTVPIPEYPTI